MKRLLVFVVWVIFLGFGVANGQIRVVNLKCEYLVDPIGIDIQVPRFFWQVELDANDQKQSAYRVICADEAQKLGMEAWLYDEDRWPSGIAGGMVTKEKKFRLQFLTCLLNYVAGDKFSPKYELPLNLLNKLLN